MRATASPTPDTFNRDCGCTESDWLRCLPEAVRDHPLQLALPGRAQVAIGGGQLHLEWTPLPPRQIALLRMPRLAVSFRFDGVPVAARDDFMRWFDLVLLRGGG